jgi:hypothetical protein
MVSSTKASESTVTLLDAYVNYFFDLSNYVDCATYRLAHTGGCEGHRHRFIQIGSLYDHAAKRPGQGARRGYATVCPGPFKGAAERGAAMKLKGRVINSGLTYSSIKKPMDEILTCRLRHINACLTKRLYFKGGLPQSSV